MLGMNSPRRTRGPRACDVCGAQLRSVYIEYAPMGWSWCTTHQFWPQCHWCQLPTEGINAGFACCSACRDESICSRDQLIEAVKQVGMAMAQRGLTVTNPTRMVLRDSRELIERGFFSIESPDQLGVTRYQTDSSGRPVGTITIAVPIGLPATSFQRILAHEYGHALLASLAMSGRLDAVVEEGYAESLALTFLELRGDSDFAQRLAMEMRSRTDTYGIGLRQVLPLVEAIGPRAAAQRLSSAAGRAYRPI